MTCVEIRRDYFNWLYRSVCYNENVSYRKLLLKLHNVPFTYTMEKDKNREADGVNLRFRYGEDRNVSDIDIEDSLCTVPCSVLEMMVALAIRIEEHIMNDPDQGDQTGKWFFEMLSSMHLIFMDDSMYNEHFVDEAINILLSRQYDYNGDGGLFTIRRPLMDVRRMEIWYQMNGYFNEYLGYS